MERLLLFSRRQSIHQPLLPNLALNEQHQLRRPHVRQAEPRLVGFLQPSQLPPWKAEKCLLGLQHLVCVVPVAVAFKQATCHYSNELDSNSLSIVNLNNTPTESADSCSLGFRAQESG